ncbi:hypothetical protein J7L02_00845 [Candidatus Woesearchaeota archaeon]|nr:hypothetical protein [Candidatus Woesearchaeota archaeon]
MPEWRLISNEHVITYQGFIDVHKLYEFIDKWFKDHGYEVERLETEEQDLPEGRQVIIDYRAVKKLTDYAAVGIWTGIKAFNLKPATVEVHGHKLNVFKGKVSVSFKPWLITDVRERWQGIPLYYVLRSILEKVLFKSHNSRFKDIARRDLETVELEVKAFFNMKRFLQ